jgi:hypothetical protein
LVRVEAVCVAGQAVFGFDRPGVKVRGSDDGTDQRPVAGDEGGVEVNLGGDTP